jgi:CRISPR-associated protein Csx17
VLVSGKVTPELRIAAGIASCATRRGRDDTLARSMRQILLPVDPPSRSNPNGKWRDTPLVLGLGIRPLRQVLADVLAWRCRTAADEDTGPGPQDGQPGAGGERAAGFRGVPGFRSGLRVPWPDLHALAAPGSAIDDGELETWLRACLALDWRRTQSPWGAVEPGLAVLTLMLLHPLAEGLPDRLNPRAPLLSLGPDWAVRLAAGKVAGVHTDAARRVRQAGWDTGPALPALTTADGVSVAAALVPRCLGAQGLLERNFDLHKKVSEQAGAGAGGAQP